MEHNVYIVYIEPASGRQSLNRLSLENIPHTAYNCYMTKTAQATRRAPLSHRRHAVCRTVDTRRGLLLLLSFHIIEHSGLVHYIASHDSGGSTKSQYRTSMDQTSPGPSSSLTPRFNLDVQM